MAKPKPSWFDEVEAYKQELQDKALESDEDRIAQEKAEARSRKARDMPARGFGKRGR